VGPKRFFPVESFVLVRAIVHIQGNNAGVPRFRAKIVVVTLDVGRKVEASIFFQKTFGVQGRTNESREGRMDRIMEDEFSVDESRVDGIVVDGNDVDGISVQSGKGTPQLE
jgi:hypothetical protein